MSNLLSGRVVFPSQHGVNGTSLIHALHHYFSHVLDFVCVGFLSVASRRICSSLSFVGFFLQPQQHRGWLTRVHSAGSAHAALVGHRSLLTVTHSFCTECVAPGIGLPPEVIEWDACAAAAAPLRLSIVSCCLSCVQRG